LELTPDYIDSLALNADTVSNGKSLVKKGSFMNLKITKDNSLIFGECVGSGKNPYMCSFDFIDEKDPIARCNCPSRQIPCKHAVGLLYAFIEGLIFEESPDVPEDIASKRDKVAKRAENKEKKLEEAKTKNKAEVAAPPDKASIAAAVKKIDTQLEGLAIAEKLLKNILQMGLAGIDAKTQETLKAQITQLGNYHIKGIQTAFNELFIYIKEKDENYTRSITQLLYIRALLKKAIEHLNAKKQDQNPLKLDITCEIEEQIEHVWKLEELSAYGCYIQNVELIQLSFNIYNDNARREFIDESYYICLQNGRVYTTKNYRPYRAVKHIKEEDTVFMPLVIDELYIYPGGLNPRIRYDRYAMRESQPNDYAKIKSLGTDDFTEAAKVVKNQIKTPLADKNPAVLLKISDAFRVKDAEGVTYLQIEDAKSNRQLLSGGTIDLLKLFDPMLLKGQAVLALYEYNVETGMLTAKPLALITDNRIIRLVY